MIRGKRPHGGYTVIEVIIVMTVSMALLVSAIMLFQGRVPRTQFSKAVNEFDSKLRDTMNEVVNGYYPNSTGNQGTDADHIVLGRVLQLGVDNGGDCVVSDPKECDEVAVYTLQGDRQKNMGGGLMADVTSIRDANPILYSESDTLTLGFGLHITSAIINESGSPQEVQGVAFVQTFGSSLANNARGQNIDMMPIMGNGPVGGAGFAANTSGPGGLASPTAVKNPSNGVIICLKSGTTDQYATITLGGEGRSLGTVVEILDQSGWNGKGCS